jgi:hypothetical protein
LIRSLQRVRSPPPRSSSRPNGSHHVDVRTPISN